MLKETTEPQPEGGDDTEGGDGDNGGDEE